MWSGIICNASGSHIFSWHFSNRKAFTSDLNGSTSIFALVFGIHTKWKFMLQAAFLVLLTVEIFSMVMSNSFGLKCSLQSIFSALSLNKSTTCQFVFVLAIFSSDGFAAECDSIDLKNNKFLGVKKCKIKII